MSTKTLLPNQHEVLHAFYPYDCCLCKAEWRILSLECQVRELQKEREDKQAPQTDVEPIYTPADFVDVHNKVTITL